jgi:hypothetical protein
MLSSWIVGHREPDGPTGYLGSGDSIDSAGSIEQRTSAVSRVDGGVGLNERSRDGGHGWPKKGAIVLIAALSEDRLKRARNLRARWSTTI